MYKYLHVVTFNIPFPPNYGGVIDVFYKIKHLHQAGIKIILHCFEYNRERSSELENFCEKIYYYKRNTGILSNLSILPYIVLSRKNKELLKNLCNDSYPILFEGIHSSYYLKNKRLRDKLKLIRCPNVEHIYYWNLFKTEKKSICKSIYYLIESFRLLLYEVEIRKADYILPISHKEADYFKKRFHHNKIIFLPAFHENEEVLCKEGKGKYALYHGNLSVPENENAAIFLIKNVFNDLSYSLIIAGLNPSKRLSDLISQYSHISLINSPSPEEMFNLIQNAHIHILITFQSTGLKLKLLNVLYEGRFCIANQKMLEGSGLEKLCEQENSPQEIKEKILSLKETNFQSDEIRKRKEVLLRDYSNTKNIQILIDLLD